MDATEVRPELLNLPAMARQLRVAQSWLKREAEAGRIPALQAGKGRYFFSRSAVEAVLLERARQRQEAAR